MNKTLARLICLALAVLALAACNKAEKGAPQSAAPSPAQSQSPTPKPTPSPSPSPSPTPKPTPSPSPTPTPTPQPTQKPELLSYEEYFAETRHLKWKSSSYIYAEDAVQDALKNETKFLNFWKNSYLAAYKPEVTSHFNTTEVLYFVLNENVIISSDGEGKNIEVIYCPPEKTDKIDFVCGNKELLFYWENGTIKRRHMQSGIVDNIYTVGEIDVFLPVDSETIYWELWEVPDNWTAEGLIEFNGEYYEGSYKPDITSYLYNTKDKQVTPSTYEYYYRILSEAASGLEQNPGA